MDQVGAQPAGDEAEAEAEAEVGESPPATVLRSASGHCVSLATRVGGDWLWIRSPGGEVVLTVVLTPDGPVLRFASAALEVAAGRVAFACERFEVQATLGASIEAERVSLRAARSLHAQGAPILLNCKHPLDGVRAESAGLEQAHQELCNTEGAR